MGGFWRRQQGLAGPAFLFEEIKWPLYIKCSVMSNEFLLKSSSWALWIHFMRSHVLSELSYTRNFSAVNGKMNFRVGFIWYFLYFFDIYSSDWGFVIIWAMLYNLVSVIEYLILAPVVFYVSPLWGLQSPACPALPLVPYWLRNAIPEVFKSTPVPGLFTFRGLGDY